jgi:hypothetical protein
MTVTRSTDRIEYEASRIRIILISNEESWWLGMYDMNDREGSLQCLYGVLANQAPWPVSITELNRAINKSNIGKQFKIRCLNYRDDNTLDHITDSTFLWARIISEDDEEIIA